ncbi:MAG: hypothetical protein H6737_15670 [Alphaproteobacteria bacterium]|nr:hypothetical protein [Alphaproteobacteria bacterium]
MLIVLATLCVPAALDLVRRPEPVDGGWWLPAAVVVFLAVGFPVWFGLRPELAGLPTVALRATYVAPMSLLLAFVLLLETVFLCGVRTLRPEGDLGRVRWPWVAGLVAWLVGVPLLVAWHWRTWLGWTLPAAFTALIVLVTVDRRGTPRIDEARAAAVDAVAVATLAVLLGVGVIPFGEFVMKIMTFGRVTPPLEPAIFAVCSLAGLVLWRLATGPWSWRPVVASLGFAGAVAWMWTPWWTFRPLPPDVEVPRWVTWTGAEPTTRPGRVTQEPCYPDHPGMRPCDHDLAVLPPTARIDDGGLGARLQPGPTRVVVDGGRGFVMKKANLFTEFALVVPVDDQHARWCLVGNDFIAARHGLCGMDDSAVEPQPVPEAVPMEQLVRELREARTQIVVARSPEWTVQQWVSLCASVPEATACGLR